MMPSTCGLVAAWIRLMVSGNRSTAMPASSDISAPRISATDATMSVVLIGLRRRSASRNMRGHRRSRGSSLARLGRADEAEQRHDDRDHQGDRAAGHRRESARSRPTTIASMTSSATARSIWVGPRTSRIAAKQRRRAEQRAGDQHGEHHRRSLAADSRRPRRRCTGIVVVAERQPDPVAPAPAPARRTSSIGLLLGVQHVDRQRPVVRVGVDDQAAGHQRHRQRGQRLEQVRVRGQLHRGDLRLRQPRPDRPASRPARWPPPRPRGTGRAAPACARDASRTGSTMVGNGNSSRISALTTDPEQDDDQRRRPPQRHPDQHQQRPG